MSEGSDRAGEFADPHVFCRAVEALGVSLGLGIPVRQLKSESDRFGVDAVSAADHGGVLELKGTALEDVSELSEIGSDDF